MTTRNWNQIQVDMEREVKRIGFTFVADRAASTHPDDWFLRIVLGYRESDDSYATWLYNADRGGLFHGRYDLSQSRATEDFLARV